MRAAQLLKKAQHTLKANSPSILSFLAITGVATTAYLTGIATLKSREVLLSDKSVKDKAKEVAPAYIPAASSGALTIGAIIGSNRISHGRSMAAQAALVISERAYSEYRGRVIDEYGDKKDKAIRDQVAEEIVRKQPPPPQALLFTGPGNVLCCELYTRRYFASDIEYLRKCMNELNAQIIRHDVASLEDWHHMIGLYPTSHASDLGWNSDRLMELEFTTILTEDERPCLAFDYNYVKPLYDGLFT